MLSSSIWNQLMILITCTDLGSLYLSEEGNARWDVWFQTSMEYLSHFECSEMLPVVGGVIYFP